MKILSFGRGVMTKKDFENLEIGKTFVVGNKTLKVKKL